MTGRRKPDFIIIGAPRSGTTAMARYLASHQDIFFSDPKEPHYFGSDLRIRTPFRDESNYRALFAGAGARMTGEGSVFYLLSTAAPGEIAENNSETKLIAMLRNPVDVMYSLYWKNLTDGRHEDLRDFRTALAAEYEREKGIGIPPTCTWPDALRYREVVRYASHLKRYLSVFPRSQLHTILYDDFEADPPRVYLDVLTFLGLQPPTANPERGVVNAHREWTSTFVRDVRAGSRLSIVRSVAGRVLSERSKLQVSAAIRKTFTATTSRPPLDKAERARLTEDCLNEIADLERLLGLGLDEWTGLG